MVQDFGVQYTSRERFWLWVLAVLGFAGVNGVFIWAVLGQPDTFWAALKNPVSAAFVAEALVLVGVLAYFLSRWRVSRLHWAWFVLLSLVGSIAFALPVVLLWGRRDESGVTRSVGPTGAA